MGDKKTVNEGFRCDEEFSTWIMRASHLLDMSKSQFIRECMLAGYGAVKERRLAEIQVESTKYPL